MQKREKATYFSQNILNRNQFSRSKATKKTYLGAENPSITTLATNLETETSKKYHKTAKNQKTAKNSGKKYQKTPKNSSPEEKSSLIIPAFLHPKVRK